MNVLDYIQAMAYSDFEENVALAEQFIADSDGLGINA